MVWHHGTPNIGAPPRPLFKDSRGIRWVSYDRPGYGLPLATFNTKDFVDFAQHDGLVLIDLS